MIWCVTGIVSSKEGHDESHINNMKLRTKFWNVVDDVSIELTQKVLKKKVVLTAELNFQLPFEHRVARQKTWQHWLDETEHNVTMENEFFERLKGVTWIMKVDQLGSNLNTQLTEWNAEKCHVQRWLITVIY